MRMPGLAFPPLPVYNRARNCDREGRKTAQASVCNWRKKPSMPCWIARPRRSPSGCKRRSARCPMCWKCDGYACVVQALGYLPHCAQPRAVSLLRVLDRLLDQWLRSLHEAGKHAHAVDQQATVGGRMNRGLHAGGIQAQVAPFRDLGSSR